MRLSDFIQANMAQILQEWLSFARSLDVTKAMSEDALLDDAQEMLNWIAKDLSTTQSSEQAIEKSRGQGIGQGAARPDQSAHGHGTIRFKSGFSVASLVAEFRALRAIILLLWKKSTEDEQDIIDPTELTRFNEAIDQSLAEAIESYSTQKEEQIRYLDTILSASADHNCVFGLDGRFLYVNKSLANWHKLTQDQMIGMTLSDLDLTNESELQQQIDQVIRCKQPFRAEITSAIVPEKPRDFEYLLAAIIRDNGEVEAVIGTARDVTERNAAEDEIWRKANFDLLTGLPNRSLFRDRLEQEIKQSERSGSPVALLFIDLDHFKEANDMFGHDAGDLLLRQAAERIRSCIRVKDTVARLGGDEFTVILSDIDAIDHVENVASKILRELARPFIILNELIHISGSIGITLFPADGKSSERLIQNADRAMYVAKNAGRNNFFFFTEKLHEVAQARYRLIADLRQAITQRQLAVYYQPIIDLSSGAICKAEALVRWLHPERGLILPRDFIALAENSGIIGEIDDWVFAEAAQQSKRWETLLGAPFQISVNKSPLDFRMQQPNEMNLVSYLNEIGLRGGSISVEITEGVLMSTSLEAEKKLKALHDGGIRLAIDDFGTGYSSLSYLNKYEIDYIKIDRSFIHEMSTKPRSRTIAETIIVMAHKLGLQVIAEGVETARQRNWLKNAGCDFGQGFLFARPVPAAQFQTMLRVNRTIN